MKDAEKLFKDWVDRFSYKPNVKFKVLFRDQRLHLYLDYYTNDSTVHDKPTTISHYNSLFEQEFIDVYSKDIKLLWYHQPDMSE
jgi:hypothetical protein